MLDRIPLNTFLYINLFILAWAGGGALRIGDLDALATIELVVGAFGVGVWLALVSKSRAEAPQSTRTAESSKLKKKKRRLVVNPLESSAPITDLIKDFERLTRDSFKSGSFSYVTTTTRPTLNNEPVELHLNCNGSALCGAKPVNQSFLLVAPKLIGSVTCGACKKARAKPLRVVK